MSFPTPVLNLKCNIWRAQGTAPPPATIPPTLFHVPCQLRATWTGLTADACLSQPGRELIILPALTDVRCPLTGGAVADLVECPAGTGRFYKVLWAVDKAKGFPNEVRVAGLVQLTTVPGGWPFPTP